MWPFRSRRRLEKEKQIKKAWEKVVVGMIIGGAIGSIVGKHLMKDEEKLLEEDKEPVEQD
jgi:Na+/glutamate symporter